MTSQTDATESRLAERGAVSGAGKNQRSLAQLLSDKQIGGDATAEEKVDNVVENATKQVSAQVTSMDTHVAGKGQAQVSVAQLTRDLQVGADPSGTEKDDTVVDEGAKQPADQI